MQFAIKIEVLTSIFFLKLLAKQMILSWQSLS